MTTDAPVTELQRWSCFIDAVDTTHVHLRMFDKTAAEPDGEEYGSFPLRLFEGVDGIEGIPKLGLHLDVSILSDGTLRIAVRKPTPEQIAEGRAQIRKLGQMLRMLREEDGTPD